MSERYNYEQEQLNIQVQCDPTTILHRKVAKNVKTQVHRSELAPVDKTDKKKMPRNESAPHERGTEKLDQTRSLQQGTDKYQQNPVQRKEINVKSSNKRNKHKFQPKQQNVKSGPPSFQIGLVGSVQTAIDVDLRAYRSQLTSLMQNYQKLGRKEQEESVVKLIAALDNHQLLNTTQVMKIYDELGEILVPEALLDTFNVYRPVPETS